MFKRTLSILMFLFAFGFNSQGQTEVELSFRPALTSLRGNAFLDTMHHSVVRLSASLGMNFSLTEKTIMSVRILYDQKGSAGSNTFWGRDYDNNRTEKITREFRTSYDYISIPVQLRKRFGEKINFQLGLGIYTGYLIKYVSLEEANGLSWRSDDKKSTRPFDFGISAGAYAYIPVQEKVLLMIGLDDHLGLVNVSSVPVLDDGSIKHNSIGASFGLSYKLN